jgi:hypothetical protein
VIHVYLTEPVDDKSMMMMIIFKRNQENIFLLPMTNFTESAKWSTTFHHPEKIHSDVTNYLGPKMLPLIILLRNVYKNQVPFITTKYNTNTKCEHGMG